VEHSVTPHNVYDRWVELYGETLDAFYPVADTEIGRRYRRPRAPARALRTSHRHLR